MPLAHMERPFLAQRPNENHRTQAATAAALEVLRASDPSAPLSEAGQRSLHHLYVTFASPMCASGERLIGDEALDVVHEIFMDLPRLLMQYRGDGLSGWLRRIVVTRCLMRLRRRKRFVDGDIPKDAVHSADSSRTLEMGDEVRAALTSLPVQLREVVVMKYFLAMSHQEIGELLEITPTASELRLFRAVKQLRAIFGTRPGELGRAA
jgi:RNA polymerase sigma factor (sigma-70 family)